KLHRCTDLLLITAMTHGPTQEPATLSSYAVLASGCSGPLNPGVSAKGSIHTIPSCGLRCIVEIRLIPVASEPPDVPPRIPPCSRRILARTRDNGTPKVFIAILSRKYTPASNGMES